MGRVVRVTVASPPGEAGKSGLAGADPGPEPETVTSETRLELGSGLMREPSTPTPTLDPNRLRDGCIGGEVVPPPLLLMLPWLRLVLRLRCDCGDTTGEPEDGPDTDEYKSADIAALQSE